MTKSNKTESVDQRFQFLPYTGILWIYDGMMARTGNLFIQIDTILQFIATVDVKIIQFYNKTLNYGYKMTPQDLLAFVADNSMLDQTISANCRITKTTQKGFKVLACLPFIIKKH